MQGTREFAYVRGVAEKYGTRYFVHELEAFVRDATDEQLRELEAAYLEIKQKADADRISRWIDECFKNRANIAHEEYTLSQQMGALLTLFRYLAKHRIAPFSSKEVQYIEIPRVPNWDHLPEELSYLRPAAETYGIHGSEQGVLDFLDRAQAEDLEALARIAEQIRLNGHHEVIDEWFNRFLIDEHQEAWLVYWLFGVMDHAGMDWT